MPQKSKEADLQLAIQAKKRNPELSLRKLAQIYNISHCALQRRINGIKPLHVTNVTKRKLTTPGEETIAKRVLELDARAFPPRLRYVQEMANILRRERVITAESITSEPLMKILQVTARGLSL